MSARLNAIAVALAALLSLTAGCFDPIVGARCADGYVPCQGRCVAVCTVDAGGDGPGGGDGTNALGETGAANDDGGGGETGAPPDGTIGDGGILGDGGNVPVGDGGILGDGGNVPVGDGGASFDVVTRDGAQTSDTATGDATTTSDAGSTDAPLAADAAGPDDAVASDADPLADAALGDAPIADAAITDAATQEAATPPDAAPPVDCGVQTFCPGGCVNLDDDPDNCGGCGISCITGLCSGGVCQQRQAGHLVVIGHDYTVSRTAMDNIVGNAVFLASGSSANVLAYHGAATPDAIRGTDNAIQRVAAGTGRTWRKTVVPAEDVVSSLAFNEVFVIYAQAGASDATLMMLGQSWATALSDFVQAGKTVIVLEGWYPNAGTYQIVQQANLFHANSRAEVTGQTLVVARPGDAVATRVPQTYRGERGTVWFSTVDQTVVVQVATDAGIQPVVVHLVF